MTGPDGEAPRGVLVDLLVATVDSMSAWARAVGDRELGLRWRDAVTARMIEAGEYRPYAELVADAARALALPIDAPARLAAAWPTMRPWPDVAALATLSLPFGFVTNCSADLARVAAERTGQEPAFVLSAEEAGVYKPRPEIYHEACRRLGVSPADALFVAGAPYDAGGAANAGLRATMVRRRAHAEAAAECVRVVDSLHQAIAPPG